MRLYSTIALTAMAVSLAVPGVASARAKHVVHHAAHHDSTPSVVAELREAQDEIAQLRSEVNDLKAHMNQPAQASADAQAASAKADQALAAAAAANSVAVAA